MTAPTDRSLLELAAKAAGIEGTWEQRKDFVQERWYFNVPYDNQGMLSGFEWNPLLDDGDALRLAVKLNMRIVITGEVCITDVATGTGRWLAEEHWGNNPYAATRRAIVRAAAQLERKE